MDATDQDTAHVTTTEQKAPTALPRTVRAQLVDVDTGEVLARTAPGFLLGWSMSRPAVQVGTTVTEDGSLVGVWAAGPDSKVEVTITHLPTLINPDHVSAQGIGRDAPIVEQEVVTEAVIEADATTPYYVDPETDSAGEVVATGPVIPMTPADVGADVWADSDPDPEPEASFHRGPASRCAWKKDGGTPCHRDPGSAYHRHVETCAAGHAPEEFCHPYRAPSASSVSDDVDPETLPGPGDDSDPDAKAGPYGDLPF